MIFILGSQCSAKTGDRYGSVRLVSWSLSIERTSIAVLAKPVAMMLASCVILVSEVKEFE
ncbi:hypothetical protein PM082_024931 [Marasmius tenuissimus]|nr:hypothetical protein PM082_024931 [Marasmius tenuissimus]